MMATAALILFSAAPVLVVHASSGYRAVVNTPSDLPLDRNGKLATHMLLYPQGPCEDLIKKELGSPYGFEFRALGGFALNAFLPPGSDRLGATAQQLNDCPAMCIERGVDQSLVTTPMPHRYFHPVGSPSPDPRGWLRDWFHTECTKVEVGFMNYWDKKQPLKMHWRKSDGTRQHLLDIQYGERNTSCSDSYIGHKLEFDLGDTGETVFEYLVEFTSMVGIGPHPPHGRIERNVSEVVHKTLQDEWIKQGRIQRTFSSLGFKKGRLPDDLFASMGAFYYNNRDNRVREEWKGKGVFVNWWEVDVYFIQAPWNLKDSWQGRLRELVEEWVGVPLEQTDMYGLRRYEEGARLLTHVDREATHAASLIVNVAQGNLTEPWPVEVHDHANRLHEVVMEPGDIVYYESAACLHGRNKPLTGPGSYFVNIFTHYRPTGDPEWLFKENPEGTPEPLLDVGDCLLVGAPDQIGSGAVKCDNPNVGPYLSPSLFTATSGQDLYDWWVSVGPDQPEQSEGAESAQGHEEL